MYRRQPCELARKWAGGFHGDNLKPPVIGLPLSLSKQFGSQFYNHFLHYSFAIFGGYIIKVIAFKLADPVEHSLFSLQFSRPVEETGESDLEPICFEQ